MWAPTLHPYNFHQARLTANSAFWRWWALRRVDQKPSLSGYAMFGQYSPQKLTYVF